MLKVGDNPFQPGTVSETFIPDQLIAGDLKLVTDGGATITGGGVYVRGTVVGKILEAAGVAAAGVRASGTLTFSAQPLPNDTLTLNGTAITFVAEGTDPVGAQVDLGDTLDQTIENLLKFLNASSDTQLMKFSYSADGEVVTLQAVTGGTGGNALTLATTSAGIAVSGGTLSGGAANTGTGTIGSITPGQAAKNGAYALLCTQATSGSAVITGEPKTGNTGTSTIGSLSATSATPIGEYRVVLTATGATAAFDVFAPGGALLGVGNVGTPFAKSGLGFTITNGGTSTAGDEFEIFVTDNTVALFSVTDPTGAPCAPATATVGAAYKGPINFTIAQGGTKYVVGDSFTVNMTPASGNRWKPCDPAAQDGSQNPAGILVDTYDTSGGDVTGGVYLQGEFNANKLTYNPGWTIGTLRNAIRSTIYIKDCITADDPLA